MYLPETEEIPETPTTFDISVTVTDGTDAISGVSVVFTDTTDSTKKYTGTTGGQGGCTVKPVAGTYAVTATKEGYEDYTHESNVTVSADAELSITMTEETAAPGGG